MRFTIARTELLDVLSTAGKALSSRTTLPILSGILMSADGDTLTCQATDLEVSIKSSKLANVEEPGTTVVPGKLMTDIIRSLPEAAITIDSGAGGIRITCGQSSFTIRTMSAEDFPRFPAVHPSQTVTLPTEAFSELVHQVARSASRDDTRPILTGILMTVEGDVFRMVATDSYRLCVREIHLEVPAGSMEVVVPARAMEDAARLAVGSDTIEVGVSENQILFSFKDTTFVSRRIEGTFPNYRQLIPSECETRIVVDRQELTDAVKRVSLMAQHNAPLRVSVDVEDRVLTLSAQTQDLGEAKESLEVDADGQPVEIAFNHAYVLDGITVADCERISMEIVSPLKPGVIKAADEEGFTYLLMPVRLS